MNMFMRNIINNSQRRSNRPPPQQMQARRRQYGFRTGYNQTNQFQRQSNSNTLPEIPATISPDSNTPISEDEIRIPSTLQYQLFDVFININVNNLSSELINNINPRHYFSEFSYEGLNIRFFHNEILNYQNIGNEIESVLNNINEREFQNILDNFHENETINNTLHNNLHMNSREIIEQIKKHIIHGEYVHYASILKNHTCPILLTDFENEDIVSIFTLCNHAIHESTCEKYTKTFTKCPLCNHKLFE